MSIAKPLNVTVISMPLFLAQKYHQPKIQLRVTNLQNIMLIRALTERSETISFVPLSLAAISKFFAPKSLIHVAQIGPHILKKYYYLKFLATVGHEVDFNIWYNFRWRN